MLKLCVRVVLLAGLILSGAFLAPNLHAGGSGLNVVVVVNQASSNSVELANYYLEKRGIPPENVLRINWLGPNTMWTSNDFQTNLFNPLLNMLAARQLTNQVHYVVLSMDIPFQTLNGGLVNGTTSAIFYGLKTDTGPNWVDMTNSYAFSERAFEDAPPASAPAISFLTTFITSDSLAAAKNLVDQGVASDGTFPRQPIILAKSSDPTRNFRYPYFDTAIFNTRLTGNGAIMRTNLDSPYGLSNLMGFETGLYQFTISPNSLVPGAIADSVTSYGGIIFGPNDHTTLLAFINAGASGSYGTVTEPSSIAAKFPHPLVYFYQARGFSIAEAYYQSLFEPYEGIVVAEPLAAPYALTGAGAWQGVNSNAILNGAVPLTAHFTAADSRHPLQQVDLFVDGTYFKTLTNIPPSPGNIISLRLNSYQLNYTVPPSASLASITTDLTNLINSPAATNTTRAIASAYGDRIELHSVSTNLPASPGIPKPSPSIPTNNSPSNTPLSITNSAGSANAATTFLYASRNMFMNSTAAGNKTFNVSGSLQVGSWLKLTVKKTSGLTVSLSATNNSTSANPSDLANQLVSLINSNASLQDAYGVYAEDFHTGFFGSGSFLLRSRSSGIKGVATRVSLTGAANIQISPATEVALDDNLGDTQPRNHLYVTAGLTNLTITFHLDTSKLTDGYHDLTAVAYEGTHVRAQTRVTVPVVVQNSALNASLTPLDFAATNSIKGVYHLQVTANSSNVAVIRLFSTGGEYASVTNQSSATFTVNANDLGIGLHPFYALVETATGNKFRTQIFRTRFER
jgi:uncharacterized protein (TIGR03790 family)